jgi:hypothetical protein
MATLFEARAFAVKNYTQVVPAPPMPSPPTLPAKYFVSADLIHLLFDEKPLLTSNPLHECRKLAALRSVYVFAMLRAAYVASPQPEAYYVSNDKAPIQTPELARLYKEARSTEEMYLHCHKNWLIFRSIGYEEAEHYRRMENYALYKLSVLYERLYLLDIAVNGLNRLFPDDWFMYTPY